MHEHKMARNHTKLLSPTKDSNAGMEEHSNQLTNPLHHREAQSPGGSPSVSSVSSVLSPVSAKRSAVQSPLSRLVHFHRDAVGLPEVKRLLVLKVGTSTIMESSTSNFCLSNLGKFVDCVCNIKEQGYQVRLNDLIDS